MKTPWPDESPRLGTMDMNTPPHTRLDMHSHDYNRALAAALRAEYAYWRS